MKFPEGRIVIFAKTPRPGQVKTRLAVDIGEQEACDIYCAMLEHTVKTAIQARVADVVVYAYPDMDSDFFQKLSSHYPIRLYQQHGQDLGERMADAINTQLENAAFVIIIGTDCLLMNKTYLEDAADKLIKDQALVFGPAEDGGYVLVGMSRPLTAVFDDISWGTSDVMMQTRSRCRENDFSVVELPTLFDIDTLSDWKRLEKDYSHLISQLIGNGVRESIEIHQC